MLIISLVSCCIGCFDDLIQPLTSEFFFFYSFFLHSLPPCLLSFFLNFVSSFSAWDEDDDFAERGFSDLEVEFGLVAFCWVIGLVPVEGVVGEDEVTGLLLLLPLPIFNCQNKHKE